MFEFHADRNRYFEIQKDNSLKYVIPFIEKNKTIKIGTNVLEIGCGEAGVLAPFLERGCNCVGVELDTPRLILANERLGDYIKTKQLKLIGKDIYEVNPLEEFGNKFDIIILKDVIEHIHNQPKLIAEMKRFLNPDGVIFFGFPPWQMPFGGHQQINSNKWLSKLPYYHLLPNALYKFILRKGNASVDAMMEIKETGISIEQFERYVKQSGYHILNNIHFLVNPIYSYKFGWQPKKQFKIIKAIPWVRNFFTTCVYYLITPNKI